MWSTSTVCGATITCVWKSRNPLTSNKKKSALEKGGRIYFYFHSTNKMPNGTIQQKRNVNRSNSKSHKTRIPYDGRGESMGVRERFSHIARFNHKFASMVMTFVLDKMCSLCVSRRCRHHHHCRWTRRNRKWHLCYCQHVSSVQHFRMPPRSSKAFKLLWNLFGLCVRVKLNIFYRLEGNGVRTVCAQCMPSMAE